MPILKTMSCMVSLSNLQAVHNNHIIMRMLLMNNAQEATRQDTNLLTSQLLTCSSNMADILAVAAHLVFTCSL
jgi:hypothetical protein